MNKIHIIHAYDACSIKGPFRDPVEVRKQRYRPFSPSLRVETNFETLEVARKSLKVKEWTDRVHDNM